MAKFRSLIIAACGVIAVLGLSMWAGSIAAAQSEKPLFKVGSTYGIMLGCLPIPQGPPCYGEKITIRRVRSDGWIEAYDVNNKADWTYNPAQIISFIEVTESIKAE